MNILDKAGTLKAIASIGKRSSTMRADIQAAAIGAMCHANDHGDLTLATKLVKAVSIANGTQLRKYIVGHVACSWAAGKGFKKSKGKPANNVTDAIDAMWDEYGKPEADAPSYNAMNDIKSLVKAIEARATKAIDANDAAMVAVYAELYQLASK